MSIERLGAAFPGARVCPDLATALNEIEDPLVVAGSLRLVGGLLVLAEEGAEE
jgi:hypothetical protein